jgi:cytochrome b561
MPIQKYHLSLRILHWLMALIIIGLLIVGFYMASLDEFAPNKEKLFIIHKSLGVTLFVLVFIRIFFRITKKTPPLPDSIPKIIQLAANSVQYLLYLMMILMPISGYLMSSYYGFPVIMFSTPLPMLVHTDMEMGKTFNDIHKILGYCLVALLTLHILGALKHRFFDVKENDVLKRML